MSSSHFSPEDSNPVRRLNPVCFYTVLCHTRQGLRYITTSRYSFSLLPSICHRRELINKSIHRKDTNLKFPFHRFCDPSPSGKWLIWILKRMFQTDAGSRVKCHWMNVQPARVTLINREIELRGTKWDSMNSWNVFHGGSSPPFGSVTNALTFQTPTNTTCPANVGLRLGRHHRRLANINPYKSWIISLNHGDQSFFFNLKLS